MPRRRAISGYRAHSLAKFRRALAGCSFGCADGYFPISAHRFILAASRCWRISGRAFILQFPPAELTPKPAFAMIQPSARQDSGQLSPATMAVLSVWLLDLPAGNVKNSALGKGFESSAIVPEWCKCPIGAWIDRADYSFVYSLPRCSRGTSPP
jgi:hypothetical protein